MIPPGFDPASKTGYHLPGWQFDEVQVTHDQDETEYEYKQKGTVVYRHIEGMFGPVFSGYVGIGKQLYENQEVKLKNVPVIDDIEDEDERELAQEFADFLGRTPGMQATERAKALVDILQTAGWKPSGEYEQMRVKMKDAERERDEALQAAYEEVEIEPNFDDLPEADEREDAPDDDYYDVTSRDGVTVRRYKVDNSLSRRTKAIEEMEMRAKALDDLVKQGVADHETVKERLSEWMKTK